jgi:predicted phage terminase large subunit-like protein
MQVGTYTDRSLPGTLHVYGTTDWATMEPKRGKKDPDFTEHSVWGVCPQNNLYALDWWFKQVETDVGTREFLRLVKRYKPARWWNEGSLIEKSIAPYVRSEMRIKNAFVTLESLPSIEDKGSKVQSFHARWHERSVFFPLKRLWTDHVVDQLIKFPAGRWDDAVDCCGLIGRGLDQMYAPAPLSLQRKPDLVPFTEAWLTFNDDNRKPKVRYF